MHLHVAAREIDGIDGDSEVVDDPGRAKHRQLLWRGHEAALERMRSRCVPVTGLLPWERGVGGFSRTDRL